MTDGRKDYSKCGQWEEMSAAVEVWGQRSNRWSVKITAKSKRNVWGEKKKKKGQDFCKEILFGLPISSTSSFLFFANIFLSSEKTKTKKTETLIKKTK